MPAAKRHRLQKLQTIVKKLAEGESVKQACASVGVSDEWFFCHTRAGHEYEYLRDAAEDAMISAHLKTIDAIGKQARKQGDLKTALNVEIFRLSKPYRKQFGDDATVQLNQQFNHNNSVLADTKALEEARARLDETKRLEQARARDKSLEETRPARIIEIDSQEAPLALEDAPEPQRAGSAGGTSMRASETDPSSGQPIARPITESLSEKRRRWMQREREQQGGDGKNPFAD